MTVVARVVERRRAAALARHYRDEERLSITAIARRLGRAEATIKAYLYDPTGANAREVKSRYRAPAAAAARRPARAAARATLMNTVNAATPARSHQNGRVKRCARRCARGRSATAAFRPPTTGRAPTPVGAAVRRWTATGARDGTARHGGDPAARASAGVIARLNELFARLIWARDGDNDALDHFAREYRTIIGPPPPPPGDSGDSGQSAQAGQGSPGHRTADRGGAADTASGEGNPGEPPTSLGDALARALSGQRDGQLEQLSENIDLQELLKTAATPSRHSGERAGPAARPADCPTGGSTGHPWPTRC